MAGRLDGKVAVITGATSGIGEATARLFAAEGAALIIAGRAVDKGEALARELGTNVVFQRADVLREADIAALVDAAVTRFGRLDCLFNNAGAVDRSTVESVTEEDFANTMKLLLGGVVFGIKHAARVMKPRNSGCIINNSSIAAHRSGQGGYLYSAAKAEPYRLCRRAYSKRGSSPWPDQASTPQSCVSAPSGWFSITPPTIPRSGRRSDRSARSWAVASRRSVAGCARPSAMPASGRA